MINRIKSLIKFFAVFIDYLIIPLVIIAIIIMYLTRKIGIHRLKISKYLYFKSGIFPVTKHYYDPFFSLEDISSATSNRKLPGISLNEEDQLLLLKNFSFQSELKDFPINKVDESSFFWKNGSFESGDAETWFNFIRFKKPKMIIEIGSGYSTLLAIEAIKKNKLENNDYSCEHICIEPYEMSWLENKDIRVIREKVEDVDIKIFEKLNENDFLFIDSSHMIKRGGDVLHEYLQILPSLNKGVIVHIHDIFTPNDYPSEWVSNYLRFWNEQYLLESFMTNNSEWSVLMAVNYMQHNHYNNLEDSCYNLEKSREPGSFYIQKY
jgi:hypothetical protein